MQHQLNLILGFPIFVYWASKTLFYLVNVSIASVDPVIRHYPGLEKQLRLTSSPLPRGIHWLVGSSFIINTTSTNQHSTITWLVGRHSHAASHYGSRLKLFGPIWSTFWPNKGVSRFAPTHAQIGVVASLGLLENFKYTPTILLDHKKTKQMDRLK